MLDYETTKVPRLVAGVGPETETVVNEQGGKQSDVPYRFDLLDPKAMFAVAQVIAEGTAKYGVDNWRAIDTESHVNHAIIHFYAWLAGDQSDDHLAHALCRALFAVAVHEQGGPQHRG